MIFVTPNFLAVSLCLCLGITKKVPDLPLIVLHPITPSAQACSQSDNFGGEIKYGETNIFSFNVVIMWFVTPIILFCLFFPTAV